MHVGTMALLKMNDTGDKVMNSSKKLLRSWSSRGGLLNLEAMVLAMGLIILVIGLSMLAGEFCGSSSPVDDFGKHVKRPVRILPVDAADDQEKISIGIGCAITTRGAESVRYRARFHAPRAMSELVFFTSFLPSFCRTSSDQFHFRFAVAHDRDDHLLSVQENSRSFERIFHKIMARNCPQSLLYSITILKCPHSRQPARAQNDAMMLLYRNNVDYLYRVNDDTTMKTLNWENMFIDTLKAFDPPNVGVVGPETKAKHHRKFLTYDFVHKTHVDIFGFYYPHVFIDWYADQWIDKVYRPDRSQKVASVVHVHNFKVAGQRYIEHTKNDTFKNFTIAVYKGTLERYLSTYVTVTGEIPGQKTTDHYISRYLSTYVTITGEIPGQKTTDHCKKIIAMCLWGSNLRYTHGAIRNAQLAPVIFTGWTLRVYVPPMTQEFSSVQVPWNILRKLVSLGADVRSVPVPTVAMKHWMFSILNETADVDVFIIRDPDMRLTLRDVTVVEEWRASDKTVHCIRESPDPRHGGHLLDHNLLGAKPKLFEEKTGLNLARVVEGTLMNPDPSPDDRAVDNFYRALKDQMQCYDVMLNRKDTSVKHVPPRRRCGEYIGQKFNATDHPLLYYQMTRKCKLLFWFDRLGHDYDLTEASNLIG